MAISLSTQEHELAEKLVCSGMDKTSAILAIVLCTREHARPEDELLDIVRQYPGLEDADRSRRAIADLKKREWLVESISYNIRLLHQHENLRKMIAVQLNDSSVEAALSDLRSSKQLIFKVVGSMNDRSTYESFARLLNQAQSHIRLPMLATSPKLSVVQTLKERAAAGVKVRILLAAPKIVAKLRGEPMREAAKESIAGWHSHSKSCSNFKVRVAQRFDHVIMASGMLIDDRVLRIDIYDPEKQRSLEGFMVEFENHEHLDHNLFRLLRNHFDEAWQIARPVGFFGAIVWFLRRQWNWSAGAVFAALAMFFSGNVSLGIFASIAATFFVTAMIESWTDLRRWIRGET